MLSSLDQSVDELQKKKNKSKSSVRAKVEHIFRIVKRSFGFEKVRDRGIAKNHNRLCAMPRLSEPRPASQTVGRARVEMRLEPGKPASITGKTTTANRTQAKTNQKHRIHRSHHTIRDLRRGSLPETPYSQRRRQLFNAPVAHLGGGS